jgi:two-component system, NtrC family, sensor kinase
MNGVSNLSIPKKLMLLSGITITISLVIASTVLAIYSSREKRLAKIQQLTTLGEAVASNSTAAVSFNQVASGEQLLQSLEHYPTVTNATIWTAEKELFAAYDRVQQVIQRTPPETGIKLKELEGGAIEVVVPIIDQGETLGFLTIHDSMTDLSAATYNHLIATITIMVCSLFFGLISSIPLQRSISLPLIRLTTVAEQITQDLDFSVRVKHNSLDEIGRLYRQFNNLIERVEESGKQEYNAKRAIEKLNSELEGRVRSRTELLEHANIALEQKIKERDAAHHELQFAQTKLIETSRKAGMADIANGVLHNIGNVLNSLNVGADVVDKRVSELSLPRLRQGIELMQANSQDLPGFFAGRQGSLLPGFLKAVTEQLGNEQQTLRRELVDIKKHVDHIKDIVRSQQSYAGASGVLEFCMATELFEDAIKFLGDALVGTGVELIRDFQAAESINVEKTKLIQMLVNLIKNAKESILQQGADLKQVTLRTLSIGSDIQFQVQDTGIGISQENISKIFAQGFTTKQNGHGFGLHASANQAKEMGGTLQVISDGPGKGATFVITLPKHAEKQKVSKPAAIVPTMNDRTSHPSQSANSLCG